MIKIEKHPEEVIEVDQRILDSMKNRLSEKKEEKETYHNIFEDCIDYKEAK